MHTEESEDIFSVFQARVKEVLLAQWENVSPELAFWIYFCGVLVMMIVVAWITSETTDSSKRGREREYNVVGPTQEKAPMPNFSRMPRQHNIFKTVLFTQSELDFYRNFLGWWDVEYCCLVKFIKMIQYNDPSLWRYLESAYAQQLFKVAQSRNKVNKGRIRLTTASDYFKEDVTSRVDRKQTNPLWYKEWFESYLKECPKPDAFCRIHVDVENPRQEIYFCDPGYKGFVRLTCREKCSLDFHISCWKTFKSLLPEKHNDKRMLDKQCPTPSCGSTIKTIYIYRKETDHAVQLVSTMKEPPRIPRPVIKQRVTDPEKLKRKQELKKQRKQRKAEAIEKKRKERENEEGEDKIRSKNSASSTCKRDAQIKTGLRGVYKGEPTVLLKAEPEVFLEGKQKSLKPKKKKEKPKVISVDVPPFMGDKENVVVSTSSLDDDGDIVVSDSGPLLMHETGFGPVGNGLLQVPTSARCPDEMADNLHEFLSDFLRVNGPQEKDSRLLQEWMSDFPEEAIQKISSFGGLLNFILANKRFAVVSGKILCNVEDQAKAMTMANMGSSGRILGNSLPEMSRPQQPAIATTEFRSGSPDHESGQPSFSRDAGARKLSKASSRYRLPTSPPSPPAAFSPSDLASFHTSDKDDIPSDAVLTAEDETQTDKISLTSTTVNLMMTPSHTNEVVDTASDLQTSCQIIKALKIDLEAEKKLKSKLMISLGEMTREKNMALEKMKQASTHFQKQSQASENQILEMKKQVAQEQKRAIESEKKFVHIMYQLLAQKLKSRRSEGQKHLQQLIWVMESMKMHDSQPPPAIISKSKELELFEAECHTQLQTLSTVFGRYKELLDEGTQLEELPDITTTVVIPEMPKPPSSDEIKQALQAISCSKDSSVPRVAEPIPQSSLVEPSHLRAEDANSESRGSTHVSGHSSSPSFTKMAPFTVPLTQRFPETNSVASQLTIGDQAQPMTASEQIMTELQSSTPSLFRDGVFQMLDELRVNVREISNDLAAKVKGQEGHEVKSP